MTVLRASGLGLRAVFTDLTLEVPAGAVVALCGPAGSGRSMALLALAGRAATTEGELLVGGATRSAEIRRLVAVARIGGAVELEPDLTAGDHIRERTLLGGVSDRDPGGLLGPFRDVAGTPVRDLSRLDVLLLSVALAAMDDPAVLVVDDVDLGLDDADRARAWTALLRVAADGPAVVAAATEPAPAVAAGIAVTRLGGVACAS
jgi:ABC-2 type transport system ATP-binding protein